MPVDLSDAIEAGFDAFGCAACIYRPPTGGAGAALAAVLAAPTLERLGFGEAGAALLAPAADLRAADLAAAFGAGSSPRPVQDPGGTALFATIDVPADDPSVPAGMAGAWRIRAAEPDRLGLVWRCTLERAA